MSLFSNEHRACLSIAESSRRKCRSFPSACCPPPCPRCSWSPSTGARCSPPSPAPGTAAVPIRGGRSTRRCEANCVCVFGKSGRLLPAVCHKEAQQLSGCVPTPCSPWAGGLCVCSRRGCGAECRPCDSATRQQPVGLIPQALTELSRSHVWFQSQTHGL